MTRRSIAEARASRAATANGEQVLGCIDEVLALEVAAIQRVRAALDERFTDAVNSLLGVTLAGGRIAVSGVGKNYAIAAKLTSTFSSIGVPALFLDSSHALHGDLGSVCPGDAVIYLSRSGDTEELLLAARTIRDWNAGNYQLAVTCNPSARIAGWVDQHLSLPLDREADPHDIAPTASSTLLLSVGDAIGIAVSMLRGFSKEEFLRFHPGGSLGARLRVELARKGGR